MAVSLKVNATKPQVTTLAGVSMGVASPIVSKLLTALGTASDTWTFVPGLFDSFKDPSQQFLVMILGVLLIGHAMGKDDADVLKSVGVKQEEPANAN